MGPTLRGWQGFKSVRNGTVNPPIQIQQLNVCLSGKDMPYRWMPPWKNVHRTALVSKFDSKFHRRSSKLDHCIVLQDCLEDSVSVECLYHIVIKIPVISSLVARLQQIPYRYRPPIARNKTEMCAFCHHEFGVGSSRSRRSSGSKGMQPYSEY